MKAIFVDVSKRLKIEQDLSPPKNESEEKRIEISSVPTRKRHCFNSDLAPMIFPLPVDFPIFSEPNLFPSAGLY